MTDLLLKPDDTGEIPRDPGQTTTNLAYVTHAPLFRRPDATTELPLYAAGNLINNIKGVPPTLLPRVEGPCRRIVIDDAPDEFTTAPAEPPKLPPPPPPKVDDRPLSEGEEIPWTQATLAEALGVYGPRRSVAYVMSASRQPGPRGRHRKAKKDPTFGWLTLAVQRILNAIVIGGGR